MDPISALQHRPFSWYLQRTTSPSSPASSTINLFLDEDDSVNAGMANDKVLCKTDNGEDQEEEENRRKNSASSEGGSHPPLLPAGFRNFTRYLDSKFGPDSNNEEQQDRHRRHHHNHQSRNRRESLDNDIPPVPIASSGINNRSKHVTDAKPKTSNATGSGVTEFHSDSSQQTSSSGRMEESGPSQRFTSPWCAPYWCPPPTVPTSTWYPQVASQPPPPPLPLLPLPLPPMPPSQVRYLAPPPLPPPAPPNTAAACWFRAAANHFATAAAIFAADNAAAASAMTVPLQLQVPHSTAAGYADGSCGHPAFLTCKYTSRIDSLLI